MSVSVEMTEGVRDWARLQTVITIMDRVRELELAKIGLNMAQATVLYCLGTAEEPMTPMKLSRMMHKQPHTVLLWCTAWRLGAWSTPRET